MLADFQMQINQNKMILGKFLQNDSYNSDHVVAFNIERARHF